MRCSMNCTKELLKSGSYVRSDKVKFELLKLGLTYSFDISAAKCSSQTNAAAEERQTKLSVMRGQGMAFPSLASSSFLGFLQVLSSQ